MEEISNRYSIGVLIDQVQKNSGLSKTDFVSSIGYKNKNNGLRELHSWLQKGEGSSFLLKQIVQAELVTKDEVTDALKATQLEKEYEIEQEDRARFKPHVYIVTEDKVPTPIFSSALLHNKKIIPIEKSNIDSVLPLVHKHYADNEGHIPVWGRITEYIFVESYDKYVVISTKGEIIRIISEHFIPPAISFGLKNKDMSDIFK